jgi:sulfite reductase (NADPH) hemoprotein beta-component
MNACGHHHVGHIGILGVDKDGEEWNQVSIGGAQGNVSSIGKVIGRSFTFAQIPEVIARLRERFADERFIDTVRRIGHDPFKEYVYATPVEDDEKLAGAEYALLEKGIPYDTPYYSPRF